jgi:hypothetical protein
MANIVMDGFWLLQDLRQRLKTIISNNHSKTPFLSRVSLFCLKKKDAKQSEKDGKQNSELARLCETKRNKLRMTQFCLHEPLKTLTIRMFLFGLEWFKRVNESETAAFSLCFASSRQLRVLFCIFFSSFRFVSHLFL